MSLDLSPLLAPIPGSNPVGESLRYTTLYDTIQRFRQADEDNLPVGVWESDLKKADWGKVESLCRDALCNKTKDLQVAAWLTEAWLGKQGLEGLISGLTLIHGLMDTFWDTFYPLAEDNGLEDRLMPLEWLNYQLSQSVQAIAITQGSSPTAQTMRFSHWIDAAYYDRLSKRQKNPQDFLEGQEVIPLAEVISAVRMTPVAFYHNLETQALSVRSLLESCENVIRERTGEEHHPFHELFTQIDTCLETLPTWKTLAFQERSVLEEVADIPDDGAPFSAAVPTPGRPTSRGSLALGTREDVFTALGTVTERLAELDPQSPALCLLKRALSWQDKGILDVLSEGDESGAYLQFLLGFLKGGPR